MNHSHVSASSPKLSLAMIVKNESRCLARCLQSAKTIVDEIVIADTGSTDDTIRIAEDFSAKVSNFHWIGDFAAARNFAIDKASGDWILILDADEWISESLAKEIPKFIRGENALGRLKVISEFRRGDQTFRSQSFILRLFPRGARFEGRIHEQLISPLPRVDLKGELWHDGYLETHKKADRNVKLLAAELERDPNNVYFLYQLAIEYNSIAQPEKALGCLRKAFALANSTNPSAPNIAVDLLYTIIELKKFDEGINVIAKAEKHFADYPDFFLVRGLFFMHLIRSNPAKYVSHLPQIEQSFRRCLTLGEDERRKSVRGSGTFLASYNLGVFHHVFGNAPAACRCLEDSAAQGYEPAATLLKKIANKSDAQQK
jgi:glycosyltransferase involved in cell wall biosynthesis